MNSLSQAGLRRKILFDEILQSCEIFNFTIHLSYIEQIQETVPIIPAELHKPF